METQLHKQTPYTSDDIKQEGQHKNTKKQQFLVYMQTLKQFSENLQSPFAQKLQFLWPKKSRLYFVQQDG